MGLWNPIQKRTTGKIPSVCYETDRKRGRAANDATRPFLLFHQIIFILGCIQAGDPRVNPWVPPRVLVSGPKPCAGNNWICVYLFVIIIIIIIYVLINLLNLSYFMETVMGTTFCFSFQDVLCIWFYFSSSWINHIVLCYQITSRLKIAKAWNSVVWKTEECQSVFHCYSC